MSLAVAGHIVSCRVLQEVLSITDYTASRCFSKKGIRVTGVFAFFLSLAPLYRVFTGKSGLVKKVAAALVTDVP